LISSLMMPACTGLPPGELISRTTAWEPESSNAVRIDATTDSALASLSDAISPLISITAVCGSVLSALTCPFPNSAHARKTKKASQASRMKLRQRRAVRCSCSVTCINVSSVRSQPGG
jgi:hypothetical protein